MNARKGSSGNTGPVVVIVLLALASAGGNAVHAKAHAQPSVHPAHVTAVTGPGETAFFTAVLSDLGARATKADLGSLAAWASREGPWGSVGQWNPLDTTLYEPGATTFNTFYSNGSPIHVWNYPNATEGAQVTAVTLTGYPRIVSALRSGAGLCGSSLAGELGKWSGGGYQEVC